MLRNIVNMVMQGSHITHEVGITHLKIKRGDEKGMDDQKQLVQIKDLFSQWKRLLSVLLGAIVISWGCTKIYPLYSERILNLHLPKTELHIRLLRFVIFLPLWALVCSFFAFGFTKVGDWLHCHRFYVGAGVIVSAVVLNISGSSLGIWNFWLGEDDTQDLVFGVPRSIRSDEYAVGTPLAFAQSYNDYGYFNALFGNKPADMFIIKDAPVWFPTEVFRPFHWGYLLLGNSAGLAFYWNARLVVLFLAAYQFFLCIGDNKKQGGASRSLAVLGAVLITFAPLTQWWFAVNGLPEMLIAVFVSICCFDCMLHRQESWIRLLCCAIVMQCAGMFILTLYPAWQIPMGYVLVGLIIAIICRYWGKIHFKRVQIVGLGILLVVFAALMGIALNESLNTIQSEMNTSYPGSRVSTGGGRSFFLLFSSLATFCLPFKEFFASTMLVGNNVEVAAFIDLCPLGILFAVSNMVRRRKIDFLDCYFIMFIVFLSVFGTTGFPAWLSKLTFMSLVPSGRTTVAIGICNIILLVRCAKEWCENHSATYKIIVAGLYAVLSVGAARLAFHPYLGNLLTIICLLVGIILVCAVVLQGQTINKLVVPGTIFAIVFSGMSINPIQYSTRPLTDQPTINQIRTLQNEDPGVWITEGDNSAFLANLLVANGIKTFNTVAVTPDIQGMKRIDPNGKWQSVYNRYAFIGMNIVDKPAKQLFTLVSPDAYTINLTPEQLRKLGVNYVLSSNDLDKKNFDVYRFVRIGKTISGKTPFELCALK